MLMKLAKLSIGGIEFGTHMVSEDTWNGWSNPYINSKDIESFAKKVYDTFFECSFSYDLLEKVDGEWVWNLYEIQDIRKDGGKATIENTWNVDSFEKDGEVYYDIFCGHTWEHEEVA
jgi:hypothetical protein